MKQTVFSKCLPHFDKAMNDYAAQHTSYNNRVCDEFHTFSGIIQQYSGLKESVDGFDKSHLTLMSIFKDGSVNIDAHWKAADMKVILNGQSNTKALHSEASAVLERTPTDANSQVFVVAPDDGIYVDLVYMDLLHGLLGLDIQTLLHVFPIQRYTYLEDSNIAPRTQRLSARVLSPWRRSRMFALGACNLIQLDDGSVPSPTKIPTSKIENPLYSNIFI